MTNVAQFRLSAETLYRAPDSLVRHRVEALLSRLPSDRDVIVVWVEPGSVAGYIKIEAYGDWTPDYPPARIVAGLVRRLMERFG